MRELCLILALSSLRLYAQSEVLAPPEDLDQAVRESQLVAAPPSKLPERIAMEANYSEEALIAGLEGTVRLTAEMAQNGSPANFLVTESLGLGLDERAVRAVQQGWKGRFEESIDLRADFILPEPRSRWHLVDVIFFSPEGAQRPRFARTTYPAGAGVAGNEALEHAQVVAATGRQAWVALVIDIDEQGIPVDFLPLNTTHDMWGEQAIAFVREWRFQPALMNGKPVASRCALGLTWGARNLDVDKLTALRATIESATPFLLSPEGRSR